MLNDYVLLPFSTFSGSLSRPLEDEFFQPIRSDPAERLDRDMSVSADRLGEGRSEEIRAVPKLRMVAVSGNEVSAVESENEQF